MAKDLKELTGYLEGEAERLDKAQNNLEKVQAQEEDAYNGFDDTKIKLIPTPNFTDCKPVGTMLPINMASETVTNLSKLAAQFDFVDFVKEKLNYGSRVKVAQCFASEQVDALVLAIKSFEKNNAFILGDQPGIGKGRVCAGVLRYAYQQGFMPVFITHKPYLFTDIYRDLSDIDGFGFNAKTGKLITPKPFIFNGNEPDESGIKNRSGEVIATPLKPKEILDICRSGKLPKEFNCIFLTYSQLSHTKEGNPKQGFLESIAPKTIFVFDESHNAASANDSSRIMKRTVPIIEACNAVLFSSATYAKTPDVFGLYVLKTALRTAVPSLESIASALKVGGENVSEYIASGLVKEGQMIRRERSFSDCKKVTEYVGTTQVEDDMGNAIYSPVENDNQRQFYNEAIGYFKELRDFSKTDLAQSAIYNSILRRCVELRKDVVLPGDYEYAKNAKGDGQGAIQRDFINRNRDKWVITYAPDSISRYKATFRENLFLAVKAKFAADKVIQCLTTPVRYRNVDGSEHFAPLKPLIAVRNTGEAIFNELDLKEGEELTNDFSEYLKAVYRKLFSGNFKLRKVDNNIFETVKSLIDRDIYDTATIGRYLIEEEYQVQLSDFADNGIQISEIQSRLDAYKSELPLSVIDYLRDRIESTERPDLYYTDASRLNPKYGAARDTYFKLSEATGRKSMLVRNGNVWVYSRNNKVGTTKIFLDFNSGNTDVMLLNVTASTGGSAQSSPKEGIDTRPRNMFIVQFELDINVEVQKRGRVNRTGQENTPTYTYVISKIPVELRTYLMFRKKLRKLDANTSANQTASAVTSEIYDDNGKPIEDIFNAYGFNVFSNDFIDLPQNFDYKKVNDEIITWKSKNKNYEGDAEKTERNIEEFNAFVREIELYPVGGESHPNQEYFFNQMNEKYIQEVQKLKTLGEYQLELEAQDYKAALKQRVVIQLNSGSTVFSLPLFLTDLYTLESNRAWRKERVEAKSRELAVTSEGSPISPEVFWANLIEDYELEFGKAKADLMNRYREGEPKRADYANGEDFSLAFDRFKAREFAMSQQQNDIRTRMVDFLRFYKPMRPVVYKGNLGAFVGYKIKDTKTRFKYSDGSIDFIFCFLSRYSILHLKVSSDLEALSVIKETSNLALGMRNPISQGYVDRIREWRPDYNKRTIRRFLTGNILSGIVDANNRKYNDEVKNWSLVRYTNIDGSVSTGIELKYDLDLPDNAYINVDKTTLAVAADNENLLTYVEEMPVTTDDISKNTVIWNTESEKVIERSVVIFKKQARYSDNIFYIQFLQPFIEVTETIGEDDNGKPIKRKTGEIIEVDTKSTRYSKVYHDDILKQYRKNQTENRIPKAIKYALMEWEEAIRGVKTIKTKYNNYKVYVKTFMFNMESEKDTLNSLLRQLYSKYNLSFDFRSSGKDYFNEETRPDVFNPETATISADAFPDGEYNYRFTKPVTENIIETIPDLISRTFDSVYGGVVLKKPLSPTFLKSYELKPYRLPNDILIKLTFSVLSDEEKTEFAKRLEEESGKSAFEVGQFIQQYLALKSVATQYFFGDLRMGDYGLIFKEFALNNDVLAVIIDEEASQKAVELEKRTKAPAKTTVNFDDAENFLITLL